MRKHTKFVKYKYTFYGEKMLMSKTLLIVAGEILIGSWMLIGYRNNYDIINFNETAMLYQFVINNKLKRVFKTSQFIPFIRCYPTTTLLYFSRCSREYKYTVIKSGGTGHKTTDVSVEGRGVRSWAPRQVRAHGTGRRRNRWIFNRHRRRYNV